MQPTKLKLTGQGQERSNLDPHIKKLESLVSQREEVWKRLSIDKKKLWLEKDPILALAFSTYKYLDQIFKEVNDG